VVHSCCLAKLKNGIVTLVIRLEPVGLVARSCVDHAAVVSSFDRDLVSIYE